MKRNPNPFCGVCSVYHGPLYICPHYEPERKAEIEARTERVRENMCRPEFAQEELAKGVPMEGIVIMAAFMGLELKGAA